jgi:hypothetical protein
MAKINSNLEARIPRFVSDMNSAAERAGLDVIVDINTDEDEITSSWTGTWAQLVATGMIPQPIKLPVRYCYLRTPFIAAQLRRQGTDTWQLKGFHRLPAGVRHRADGAIEETIYRPYDGYKIGDTWFHGYADVLLREGIVESASHIPKGLGPAKYWSTYKSSYRSPESWVCRLLFDGSVLYKIEGRDRVFAPRCVSEFANIKMSREKANAFAAARADVQFQSMLQRWMR